MKSYTLLSSLVKVKFLGIFCSYIESISSIEASNETISSSQIFCFQYFLGMMGVFKSDKLEIESLWLWVLDVVATAQELTFFATFYNFFFTLQYISLNER